MIKTILVVDNFTTQRRSLLNTLRGAGYIVIESCDGQDALNKLTGQRIHLIISNVKMPNMDGFTLIHEIKQLPNYKYTPVILMSTESGDEKQIAAHLVPHVKAWIIKPFQPEQILNTVARIIYSCST